MLTYTVDARVKYTPKVWKFPSGEVGVNVAYDTEYDKRSVVLIYASINSSDEVMQLLMLTDALRRQYYNASIDLVLGYVPYARQDRVCNPGDSLSIAVFAKLINAQNYRKVLAFDTHSYVTDALIDRLTIAPQFEIFNDCFLKHIPVADRDMIMAPDAGAMKKTEAIFKSRGAFKEISFANKTRDMKTGQITSIKFDADVKGKSIVIVDDIIDGGATFIGLAAELRARGAKKLTLCVTHGIFTKGHESIVNTFDAVYATNSYHQDRIGEIEGVVYCEVI